MIEPKPTNLTTHNGGSEPSDQVLKTDPFSSLSGAEIPLDTLVFNTTNIGKLREIAECLGQKSVKSTKLEVDEIQLSDADLDLMRHGKYEEAMHRIITDKAIKAFHANGCSPVVVEDTALFLHGLDGLPGPLIKMYYTDGLLKSLCSDAVDSGNMKATAITIIAYYNGKDVQIRSGITEGMVPNKPSIGKNGFGWDKIFIPSPREQKKVLGTSLAKTNADLTPEEKALFSMRVRALGALKDLPFRAAPAPRSVEIDRELEADFKVSMKKRIPEEDVTKMGRSLYKGIVDRYERIREGLDLKSRGNEELYTRLILEGELADPISLEVCVKQGKLNSEGEKLSPEIMQRALAERHYDLIGLTHPVRLESFIAMQKRGFVSLAVKEVPCMETLILDGTAVTYHDFSLKPKEPDPGLPIDEKTLTVHASGLWLYSTNRRVGPLTHGSSMPTAIGSWCAETLAVTGAMSFIPTDAVWNNVDAQIVALKRAHQLLENEPAILEHPHRDYVLSNGQIVKDFLIQRGRECLGVTLKPDPLKAVLAARKLIDEGVSVFRVYDAGSTLLLEETVKALRKEFGERIEIIAGQVTGPEQALRLERCGANAVVVGIGDGEMCQTSIRADISGNNPIIAYQIAKDPRISIPVLCDGGVGDKTGVLLGLGAAGRMRSGGLSGGRIEMPSLLYYRTPDGVLAKPYVGEAAPGTKLSGGNVDYLGRPYNVEGVDGVKKMDKIALSVATGIYEENQALAKAARFQRVESLELIQHMNPSTLGRMSPSARFSAYDHHNGS